MSPDTSPSSSQDGIAPDGSGRGLSSQIEPQPRKKKWAPKGKTGCLTCRTRRIKCDEAKPACKKCFSTGRNCLGYEDRFVSSTSRKRPAGQEAAILPRPETAASASEERGWQVASAWQSTASRKEVVPEFGLEPFEWDFMQCARHYLETVYPTAFINIDKHRIPLLTIKTLQNINRPRFIIHSTGEYLNRISRAQNALPHPSALPATRRLWQKFHHYAIDVLRDVNDNIRKNDKTPEGNATVLVRIFSLVNAELYTLGPSWRAHIIGFLAFVKMRSSFEAALKTGLAVTSNMWVMINAVLVNTTSPADNQIMPMYEFSLEEIGMLYSHQLYGELPCPTALFLNMHRISELRMRLAAGESVAKIRRLAQDTVDDVERFDTENWTEPYTVPDKPEVPVLARAYKAAVLLYAIMTLPRCVSAVTGEVHCKADVRDALMKHIREAIPMLDSKLALHWCLPVAGVALADGPLEDREYIEYIFMGLKQGIEFYFPFYIRDTLRKFWASGSTFWDDCWTEPFPPLC